ncbi:Hypp1480 [Branchiostoma lanceolatum]|uniref:Hypp1480 protein n=1 Tax=Branchiostoma lanceolatum TaxID=7740 RepID=A0A8J9ZI95_BRALA|nr:Hypp1480 [Branchiostoma lanceolatum]
MATSFVNLLRLSLLGIIATYVEGQDINPVGTTLDPDVAAKVANSIPSLNNLYVALIATGSFLVLAVTIMIINHFRFENRLARKARAGGKIQDDAPTANEEPRHVYDNVGIVSETPVEVTQL